MIEVVALDADDTLWREEPLFTSDQDRFCAMLETLPAEGIPTSG